MAIFFIPIAWFIISSKCWDVTANRVHKVHNIVLYPDRSSWCNATRIIQIINHPGCNSVKMDNNVCVGTCFSYVVPHTMPITPGYVTPYCDSCQPLETSWKHVNLECTEGELKGKNVTKYMEVIENCSCQTCTEKFHQQFTIISESNEDVDGETNLIEDSQNSLLDTYVSLLNASLTNSTVKRMNIIEDPDQVEFKNFLKKLERSNDKIDFGKLMQIKKKIEEDNGRSKTKHPCKEMEEQGPHHSSVLSRDCYETYPLGLSANLLPKLQVHIDEPQSSALNSGQNSFQSKNGYQQISDKPADENIFSNNTNLTDAVNYDNSSSSSSSSSSNSSSGDNNSSNNDRSVNNTNASSDNNSSVNYYTSVIYNGSITDINNTYSYLNYRSDDSVNSKDKEPLPVNTSSEAVPVNVTNEDSNINNGSITGNNSSQNY